jgi:hypothetical protein
MHPKMELEFQWQEHDSGEYPMIVLIWEDPFRGAPWQFMEKCEKVLINYENMRGNFLKPGVQKSKLRRMAERPISAGLKTDRDILLSGVKSI